MIYDLVKVNVSWKFENTLKSEQVLATVFVIGWKQDPSMTAVRVRWMGTLSGESTLSFLTFGSLISGGQLL